MSVRSTVADAARRLYAGETSYGEFRSAIPDHAESDPDIAALIDLIEHEPKAEGSVTPEGHKLYVAAISEKIKKLNEN
jgi:hypothetical protein